MYYAGIGSTHTPEKYTPIFINIATRLQDKYTLRSGGANGADSYFESGVTNGNKQIWLPWANFNGNKSTLILDDPIPDAVIGICKELYPRWNYVSNAVRRLHARNVYQILGHDLDSPVDFVVCYTDRPESDTGGTRFGINLARMYTIPIFNFYIPVQELMFNNKFMKEVV